MTTIPIEVQIIEVFHFFTSSSDPPLRSIRKTEMTRYTIAMSITTFLRSRAIFMRRLYVPRSPVAPARKYLKVFQKPNPASFSTEVINAFVLSVCVVHPTLFCASRSKSVLFRSLSRVELTLKFVSAKTCGAKSDAKTGVPMLTAMSKKTWINFFIKT